MAIFLMNQISIILFRFLLPRTTRHLVSGCCKYRVEKPRDFDPFGHAGLSPLVTI